jgi:Restriction endonuclease NotI
VADVLGTPPERIMSIPEIRLVPSTAEAARLSAGELSAGELGAGELDASDLMPDTKDASAGNIDYVLVDVYTDQMGSSLSEDYRLLSYAALEVQAVYISGNVSNPFLDYMGGPLWDGRNPLRPDWLSSSRKRLIPQLAWKGSVLHAWHKPIVVCVQAAFWDTMPYLSAVTAAPKAFQEMAWVIIDLERDGRVYRLVHVKTSSSQFEAALTAATLAPAGSGHLVEQAIIGKAIVQLTGRKPRKLRGTRAQKHPA